MTSFASVILKYEFEKLPRDELVGGGRGAGRGGGGGGCQWWNRGVAAAVTGLGASIKKDVQVSIYIERENLLSPIYCIINSSFMIILFLSILHSLYSLSQVG